MELKRYQRDALKALEDFLQAAFLKGANAASLTQAYAQALQAPESLAAAARPAPYQAAHFGDTPWVCLRLPTGGGKTLLASHVIERVARTWHPTPAPVVIWLTPSDVIRDQTLGALKTPGHPYLRALQSHYPQDRLRVLTLEEMATVSPQDLGAKAIVLVANIQSFRIDKDLRDKRNVYRYAEDFERHFSGLPHTWPQTWTE